MNYMHEMGIEWFCGNEWKRREGWEGIERLQEGSKGLSCTDEWALAGNTKAIVHFLIKAPKLVHM